MNILRPQQPLRQFDTSFRQLVEDSDLGVCEPADTGD
jgi:hypothetical protein